MLTESVLQDSNITVEQTLDLRLTVNDILLHISSEQVHKFIQNLPAHKHIAYCYQSKQSKDKALTESFNPTVTKDFNTGLVSLEPFTPEGNAKENLKVDTSMLYTQVFSHAHKDKITKRELNWVYFAHGSPPPFNLEKNKARRKGYNQQRNRIPAARVASEDDSWLLSNSFQREVLEAEESLGRSIKDNISCMCMYDILNVNDEGSLRSLIKVIAML
jgi:hypothetical protein